MRFTRTRAMLIAAFLHAGALAASNYDQQVATARSIRVDRLTQPFGWLTLVGHSVLPSGASTIGRAADNRIVLEAGPARFGTITVAENGGKVTFLPVAGAGVRVDGEETTSLVELSAGAPDRRPTLITAGTVGFYLVESGARQGLHVRDLAHNRLINFPGLNYFPVDARWRVTADWVPFDVPRSVTVRTIAGEVTQVAVNGRAMFRHEGHTVALLPTTNPDGSFLFVFADESSGTETYAMRFLQAQSPREGKIVLDFNLAENPPCAFSPVAVCPLPPPENRLPFGVAAGERMFRGASY